jgi:hypothetical protein
MLIVFISAAFIILVTGMIVFSLLKKNRWLKLLLTFAVSIPIIVFLYWLLLSFVGMLGGC